MEIDRETGALRVPELGGTLTPTTRRDEWLASPAGEGADRPGAGPWHTLAARGFTAAGRAWRLRAWFHEQTLWCVELMALGDEFGTGWGDWSEAKEQARRGFHDEWLAQALGPERRFAWGSVGSSFDARGGYSSVRIEYAVRDSLFPAPPG